MKKNSTSNPTIEIMLELLRSAVLDRDPVIPAGTPVDWDEMMDRASSQGILAWVWDGICKLPAEQQPSRNQRINWALSAQEIWDRYAKQKEVLADMVKVCDENNMRLLLLKGIGLSELYPKPESRPSGDIDVYFFGDFKKGNELFGPKEYQFLYKHAGFDFEGVYIENHLTPLDTDTKKRARIEQYIEKRLCNAIQKPLGYYELDIQSNLVYLVAHFVRHYRSWDLFPLRSMIDVSQFLSKYHDELDYRDCQRIFRDLNMAEPFDFILQFAIWFNGDDSSILNKWISEEKRNNYSKLVINIDSLVVPIEYGRIINNRSFWVDYFCRKKVSQSMGIRPVEFYHSFWRRWLSVYLKTLSGVPSNVSLFSKKIS